MHKRLTKNNLKLLIPLVVCAFFIVAYSILGVVKHNHYQSGYDLSVSDQGMWKYSRFENPITTTHAYPDTPIYYDHLEIIYIFLSPLYWFTNDVRVVIILQVLAAIGSGLVMYQLARKKGISFLVSLAILIMFCMFYGIQFALWSDVHSIVFAILFLALFIYCLETERFKLAAIFFILSITAKEDVALFTLLISLIQFFYSRNKNNLLYAVLSIVYLLFVFIIFFPHFTNGYRFQNQQGLLSNLNLRNFINTRDKRDAVFYGLVNVGFLPLLAPMYLVVAVADLAHYFVLGSDYVSSAQGLFGHYRSTLALFLTWPLIHAIIRSKWLNKWYIAAYLLVCALLVQYLLHLPLSYLTKHWFWQESPSVRSINTMISQISPTASLVTQTNIAPHVNHRDIVYTLWPDTKISKNTSLCGKTTCDWMRWFDHPDYLLVDRSSEWDARQLLMNNENFQSALNNLEKAKVIKKQKQIGTTVLYKVLRNPGGK